MMNRLILVFLCFQVFVMNVNAQPLNLTIPTNSAYEKNKENYQDNEPNISEGIGGIKINQESKSVLPVVLSVSFLIMSLYGDNPNSSKYRAVGAIATFTSFNWYFD